MAVRTVDPHLTVVEGVKCCPLIVRVKACLPTVAKLGLRLLMAGNPCLIVTAKGADVPASVETVTLAVPDFTIKLAGTAAISWVGLR